MDGCNGPTNTSIAVTSWLEGSGQIGKGSELRIDSPTRSVAAPLPQGLGGEGGWDQFTQAYPYPEPEGSASLFKRRRALEALGLGAHHTFRLLSGVSLGRAGPDCLSSTLRSLQFGDQMAVITPREYAPGTRLPPAWPSASKEPEMEVCGQEDRRVAADRVEALSTAQDTADELVQGKARAQKEPGLHRPGGDLYERVSFG